MEILRIHRASCWHLLRLSRFVVSEDFARFASGELLLLLTAEDKSGAEGAEDNINSFEDQLLYSEILENMIMVVLMCLLKSRDWAYSQINQE